MLECPGNGIIVALAVHYRLVSRGEADLRGVLEIYPLAGLRITQNSVILRQGLYLVTELRREVV